MRIDWLADDDDTFLLDDGNVGEGGRHEERKEEEEEEEEQEEEEEVADFPDVPEELWQCKWQVASCCKWKRVGFNVAA